jgi:hypothetical protein
MKIDKYGNYTAYSTAWAGGVWAIGRTADTANASTEFLHRGTGALFFNAAEAGEIQFGTSNTIRIGLSSSGHLYSVVDQAYNIGTLANRFNIFIGASLNLGTSASNGVIVRTGTGSPEGVVTANMGSLYLNLSGGASTTLYVKQTGAGNTGWVGK